MDQVNAGKETDFEQALLSNVELCYSVAMALTHNPNQASALAKETLLRAWQGDNDGVWDVDTIKMRLLREMRDRYRRQTRALRNRLASAGQQRVEAGV